MAAINSIPTRLLLQPARQAIADGQRQLARAQSEQASGRHDDVTLALGARTGADISLRVHLSELEQSSSAMSLASLKAQTVQDSLSTLNSLAERFRSTITGARTSENGRMLSATLARTSLDALHDALSVTQDGQYLFAGLASDAAPLNRYDAGPRQAVIDAFRQNFGFPPDDPAAANLSATDIGNFLDGTFAALFSGGGWNATWSGASDETPKFRLLSGATVDVAATANAPFAQRMAQAFSVMDVLGQSKINAVAFTAAADKSLSLVSEAQARIGDEQARIGIGEARIKDAKAVLEQKKPVTTAAISTFESIDPYEAATRVNVLMTQLESSYSLTGRISRMNLLSYL